jgi:hypothetical protein
MRSVLMKKNTIFLDAKYTEVSYLQYLCSEIKMTLQFYFNGLTSQIFEQQRVTQ